MTVVGSLPGVEAVDVRSPERTAGPTPQRATDSTRRRDVALGFIAFGLLSMFAYWPVYPLDPSTLPNCGCGDVSQSAWFLQWAPFALGHGLNPFATDWINYPVGANLAISAQGFLYGILLFPVTALLDAFASYNLLIWAAFTCSATSMFWVVRRHSHRAAPALVAGLFYGFSPYMVGAGLAHLNLVFVPFPPIILDALYELIVRRARSQRWSAVLAVSVVMQYMMSSEVLATTALVAILGLALLAVTHRREIGPSIRASAAPLVLAIAVVIPCLAYPVWYSVRGPEHLVAPIHAWRNQFHADLLGLVLPTIGQKLYPQQISRAGTSLLQGAWYENGSYLGIPLLLVVALITWRLWSDRWIRFAALMAAVAWLLSLGPFLTIDGHTTSIPLPFDLLRSVPLVDNILPSRIALYSDLCVALILAIGVDAAIDWLTARRRLGRGFGWPRRTWLASASLASLGLLSALSLVPAWPYASGVAPLPNAVPVFFRSRAAEVIPSGSVVLAYPYPLMTDNEAMEWQVLARMRFKLVGGYDLFTIPPGIGSGLPAALQPEAVESALSYLADANTYPLSTPPPADSLSAANLRSFVMTNHVNIVIVNLEALQASRVVEAVSRAFGGPTLRADHLGVWDLASARLHSGGERAS